MLFYTHMVVAFYAETERVILRPWQDGDVQALHQILQDPFVNKYVGPWGYSYTRVDKFVARAKKYIKKHDYGYYACQDKETGAFIGFAGITPLYMVLHDPQNMCLTGTVVLARECWGKGYAYELGLGLMRLGFEKYNAQEFGARIDAANTRAIKLASRCFLSYKGEFNPPFTFGAQSRTKEVVYAISKEEYLKTDFGENTPTISFITD